MVGCKRPPDATPVVVIDTTVLFNALSASSIPLDRLPPGTTSVSYSIHSELDDVYGLVGSVFATVNDEGDPASVFWSIPMPRRRSAGLQSTRLPLALIMVLSAARMVLSYPSYEVTQGGFVSCMAVNGPVAVLGVMTSAVRDRWTWACALTLAGLGWVNTTQAGI